MLTAFHDGEPEREVRLVQINANGTFSAAVAIGMHLLDTVIHTWDVATSLGNPYRPDDDLVEMIAAQASRVPAGSARTRPVAHSSREARPGQPQLTPMAATVAVR